MSIARTLAALTATACLLPVPAAPPAVAAQPAAPASTTTTATPDYDGDGKADLAFTYLSDWDDLRIRVRFGSGSTGMVTAQRTIGDEWGNVGWDLLARDLNQDGRSDLAFTASGPESGSHLCVLYGAPSGLPLSSLSCVSVPSRGEGLAFVEQPTPRLVVGSPDKSAGRVYAYALDANGRPGATPKVLQPGKRGVPKLSGSTAAFGTSLASVGAQLFVGAPGATVSRAKGAGAVVALTFTASGTVSGTVLSQATKGVPGSPQKQDGFGTALAARDGFLVVGTPGDPVGKAKSGGSVQVFTLAAGKPRPASQVSQATPGVPGTSKARDAFGRSLAIGTLCAGVPAVVVGGPGKDVGDEGDAEGSAWVIPLTASTTCAAKQLWEGSGFPGKPQAERFLGEKVAVVRAAGEAVDRVVAAGSGSYSEGPDGVVAVWSAQTGQAVSAEEEMVSALAGR